MYKKITRSQGGFLSGLLRSAPFKNDGRKLSPRVVLAAWRSRDLLEHSLILGKR
jgi:hypothetical protein